MTQLFSLIRIRWIVIYPVDSAIQRLNNRGLDSKLLPHLGFDGTVPSCTNTIFSSFSVEYSVTPFFSNSSSICLLNILSLYQPIDIVVYSPLWRWFWMLLWQFLLFYPSMGQSSHIWTTDLIPWEDIYSPCSICWIVAFQPDQSTKFYRYRLQ